MGVKQFLSTCAEIVRNKRLGLKRGQAVIMTGVFTEFKRFLRLKSILSEQSVETYLKHCRTLNNKQNLFSIDRHWIENNILMENLGNTTKRFYIRALINFFDWLRMEGVKSNNPAKEVHMPPNEPPKHKMVEEVVMKMIFKNCQNLRETIILSLYYYCGLRPRELARLRVKDINLVTCRIEVQRGKGGKYRVVPFPRGLADDYMRYRRQYKITDKDTVIKSETDGGPATYTMLKHLIYRMGRRLHVPLSGYRFRHSCITHHWEHGLDPYALQSLAGHSDLRTTQIYTKVTIGILQRKYNEVGLFEAVNEKAVDKVENVDYNRSTNNQGMLLYPMLGR